MGYRTVVYDREKLYEEVWAEPVSTVCTRYGVSGVALAKTCRKLNIPLPGRGHWTLIQIGKKIPRPPLPPFRGQAVFKSTIRIPESHLSEEVEQILSNEMDVLMPASVPVPETLHNPHPLVKLTRDALRGEKPGEYGVLYARRGLLDIRVSPPQLSRILRICSGLLKVMETFGWQVMISERDDSATCVMILGETIKFKIEERVKRSDHVLTPAEEREKARGEYIYPPRYDSRPTGELRIRINEYSDGLRKIWSDTERLRLEDRLADVLKGIRIHAAHKLAERRNRERKAREKEAIRTRLSEFQAKREHAKRRIRELESKAVWWHKAQRIRAYAEAAHETEACDEEWFRWALEHADRIDPLKDTPPQESEKSQEELELEKKLKEYWRY